MSALMAEQEQNEGIQLAVPGLGDRLRAARMACNLDLAKLAARIHLTADVVDAIERDDYAEMPARVFVRGYVRNYARAVNLPAESVLAQFDRLWPDEQQGVKRQEPPSLASDVSARRRWPRLVTWLVVLAAIGLPLVWWQGYLDQYLAQWQAKGPESAAPESAVLATRTAEPTETTVPTATGLAPLPPAAPQESTAEEPLVTPVLPPAAPSTDSSADSTVTPGDSVAEKETAPAPPDEQASPEAVLTAATGSLVEPVESEEPAVSEVVATKPAAPVEPVTAPPRITLRFTGNSWVDVRDSTRTFKLVGIMKAGTERTLGGKPPYNLVLGNAKGVALMIDGKPYDLAAHTRGNVARFTLEP